MFEQVKEALDSLKLSDKYFKGFQDNDLDDETLRCGLDSVDLQSILKDVISSGGHRMQFLRKFRAIIQGPPSTCSVNIEETLCQSSVPEKLEDTVTQPPLLTPEDKPRQETLCRSSVPKTLANSAPQPLLIPPRPPRQVQIMDFQPDPTGGSPKIIFFEDTYQRIVEKSGNRPIISVAIAGPSNKGKSVFLNFVLRYLKAKQNGTIDWMGWRDPLQPLKGFSWGNEDGVTKGIWMWSEPIPYKANGQDVDVYLMDTQGVYDESLGLREWSILVGLGMLMSSCFIFNIAQDLQEDCLQFFNSFLSFGTYALEQDESDQSVKPFQKLVFLIRDWEKFNEYPCGGDGGRKYVDKKLEPKETHSEDQKRVREEMKACFEDISCYLFPHPGEEARDVSFKGAVNSTPKFRQFADLIEACIVNLMNEDNLPVKKLQGNLLTGRDLLALFRNYTELFNSEDSPSAQSLYSSSIHNCNAAVLRQCLDVFTTQIQSVLMEHGCLDDDDFERRLMDAEKAAFVLFDSLKKMGDKKIINDVRSKLTDQIGDKSELLNSKNELKNLEMSSKVDEELRRVTAAFNASMEFKLSGSVITEEALRNVHSNSLSQANSALEKALKAAKVRDSIVDATLKRLTDSTNINVWEEKRKESNNSIQTEMEKLLSDAETTYRKAMRPEQFTSVDDFREKDSSIRCSCLAELKSTTKLLSKTGLTKYKDKLASELAAIFEDYLQQLNKILHELKMAMKMCHGNCIQEYRSSMDKLLSPSGQNPIDTEKLNKYHQQSISVAVESLKKFYKSHSHQLKDPNKSSNSAESKLKKDLSEIFKDYKKRNKSNLDNFEATARNYVGAAKEKYKEGIRKAIERVFDEEDYKKEALGIKDMLIREFMEKIDTNIAAPDFVSNLQQAFSTFTESTLTDYLEMFHLRQEEDQVAVKAALLDASKHYRQEMEKKFKPRKWFQPEELRSINSQLCENILQKCKDDVELSDRQQTQLEQSLNSIFLEYEERNFKLIPSGSCAIGIDLGTTYSCVGVYINGKVEILTERESKTVPSYVAFNDDRTIVVGDSAKDLSFRHPEHTIFDAKRLVGRKFDDPVVQQDIKLWPFSVTHDNNQPRIQCRGKSFRPEEISARILSKLKQMAQSYLGKRVTEAVVTVPAYFNDSQRQATKDAAEIAGLQATIMTEPVAAAIAYGVHHTDGLMKNVLVFDLGGGTFDVAVLQIKGGEIRTRSINGNTHLGGEDFDNDILKHLIETTSAKYGVNLDKGKSSAEPALRGKANARLRRLRAECEKSKRDLSFETVTEIFQEIQDLGPQLTQLKERLTRSFFEEMIAERLKDCLKIVEKALEDAKLKKSEIDDIVLVGGSTKIPKVREMLAEYFDGREVSNTVNPDEAVAVGAAIKAAVQNGKQASGLQVDVIDVAPMSVGIENSKGDLSIQIPRNTPLPASNITTRITVHDDQTKARFKIFEGEEKIAAANNFLGSFGLEGIPPAKPGVEKLDVETIIDIEGIVTMEATCRSSKSRNEIKILTYKGRMSTNEIDECQKTDLMRW